MTEVLGELLRVGTAAWIAALATQKLLTLADSARAMWVPGRLSELSLPAKRRLLGVVSVGELALAVLLALALLPPLLALATAALFLSIVSAYGDASIRATGKCGCSGSEAAETERRSFHRRNALLAACITAGTLAGPTFAETIANPGTEIALLAFLPAIGLGAAVLRRTLSLARPQETAGP